MGIRISDLPESTDLYDGCCLPVVTNDETKKLTYALLKQRLDIDLEKVKSIEIGNVTTGAAGTQAKIENVGTETDLILNFTIPQGEKGEKGNTGPRGPKGESGGGGSYDYEELENKPQINGVELTGNKSLNTLGIQGELPFQLGIDDDGNYGYIKVGADTVTPFKSGGEVIVKKITVNYDATQPCYMTDGITTLEADSSGTYTFDIPNYGNWKLVNGDNEYDYPILDDSENFNFNESVARYYVENGQFKFSDSASVTRVPLVNEDGYFYCMPSGNNRGIYGTYKGRINLEKVKSVDFYLNVKYADLGNTGLLNFGGSNSTNGGCLNVHKTEFNFYGGSQLFNITYKDGFELPNEDCELKISIKETSIELYCDGKFLGVGTIPRTRFNYMITNRLANAFTIGYNTAATGETTYSHCQFKEVRMVLRT